MQATTMPDIQEMKKNIPTAATKPEIAEVESAADLTTAPQQELDKLADNPPKQPKES